jgi:membrane associated rhomboid family serine protease
LFPYPQTRYSSFPVVTVGLIIANVAVFIVELLGGDPSSADNPVLPVLAQSGVYFFQFHFYWQPFTSMFYHFDPTHILFNMFGLFYFGRLNENNFSKWQYLAIYFGAGLLGNVASLYLLPPDVPSGGASGAIFGLVGAYIAIERKANHLMAGLFYALYIFLLSSGPGVNIFAHLFGLIGGVVLGLAFTGLKSAESRSDESLH